MNESIEHINHFDLVIIGGGAAGLMAAASAIEVNPGITIALIERNRELGKKVKISGGGRCNVTTGIQDIKTVLTKYPRGSKFLISAMHAFPPGSMMEWVEAHGVPLKVEDDLRVFPCSDLSVDIVNIFERILDASNAKVYLDTTVQKIEKVDDGFQVSLKEWRDGMHANAVVIATGGQAYRATGSMGDGYAFAESLGHTLTPLAASLSSFMTEEQWTADVSGVSFAHARLFAATSKAESEGGFIFTHKGISGPAVFALSAQLAYEEMTSNHPVSIGIDMFPDYSTDEVLALVNDSIEQHPKKQIVTILSFMIPKSLADVACYELRLIDQRRAIELSKKERLSIVTWLKSLPLHVIGRGAGDEFVTAGGVNTKEVNPKTMESTITNGLYFAGEVLDIDGYTGGFNLQASWATGRAAGIASASATR